MKTKFHAASEPIRKIQQLKHFLPGYAPLLAGGALREDFMGCHSEISDFDIFIRDLSPIFNNTEETDEIVVKIINKVFPRNDDAVQVLDSAYLTKQEQELTNIVPGSHAQVASVWKVIEDGEAYQLIFTKNEPIVHINAHFDIGFCKAYCDGTKIRYTDDFLHDVKHKNLTIVGDGMTKEQVEYTIYHHAEKITWKYPGFRVVVPPRYQCFVEGQGFPTF